MTFSPTVLKLNSRFNAKTVAGNISANRGGSAVMLKGSGYNTYGTNLLFTPSRRMGGTPRYMSSSQLSRALNGQNMRFTSGEIPSYSGVSYNRNVTMGTSSAFNTGMGIGATLNLAMQLAGGLKELGLFGNKEAAAPKTNTDKLNDAVNSLGGNNMAMTVPVSSDVSGTISAMENATDKASLSEAISSAEQQLGSITNEQSVYEAEAANEQAQLNELQGQTESLKQAESDANNEVKGQERTVESFTQTRDGMQLEAEKIDAQYGQAVSEYNKAHDAHVDAQSARDGAKANAETANNNLTEARNNTKSAQTSFNEAKAAYDSCPKTRINPATQQQEPNEPQLSEARAKMNIAQERLREAQLKEKNAETCKTQADDKLKVAEDNVKSTEKTEADALKKKNDIADSLKDKQAEIKNFESKLKKQQDLLDTQKGILEAKREKADAATQALEIHQQKMESLNCATNLAKTAKNNIENLQDTIGTQKTRLQGMPEDEKKKDESG